MVFDRYEKLRKTARNTALLKYREDNPESTLEEIGNEFNITKQRVSELLNIMIKKKAMERTTA